MILAEKRGLLTPKNRAAARAAIDEKYLAAPNVIGVIVGQKTFPSLRAKRSNPSHHGENMDCFVARSSR